MRDKEQTCGENYRASLLDLSLLSGDGRSPEANVVYAWTEHEPSDRLG